MDERVKELFREAREALREAFLVIARHEPLSHPAIKQIDRASERIDAALSGAPLRERLSDAELLGDPARTVGWPTDQGAAQQGRAPEAPLGTKSCACGKLSTHPKGEQFPARYEGAWHGPDSCGPVRVPASPAAAAPEAGEHEHDEECEGTCAGEQSKKHRFRGQDRCIDWSCDAHDAALSDAAFEAAHGTTHAAPSPRPPEPEGRRKLLVALERWCNSYQRALAVGAPDSYMQEHRAAVAALKEASTASAAEQPSAPDPAPAAASAGLCEICGRESMPPCPHQSVEGGSMRCMACGHTLHGYPPMFVQGPIPKNPCKRAYYADGEAWDAECYRLGYERLRAASAGLARPDGLHMGAGIALREHYDNHGKDEEDCDLCGFWLNAPSVNLLPEKPSEARAASAGEVALRAQVAAALVVWDRHADEDEEWAAIRTLKRAALAPAQREGK